MQNRVVLTALALAAYTAPASPGTAEPRLATLALEPGVPGRATLVNEALAPLGVSQCAPVLQRAEGDDWMAVGETTGDCGERRQLMPGDSGTLTFTCPSEPGTYRLVLEVVLERPTLEPLTAATPSSTFTLPARSRETCAH